MLGTDVEAIDVASRQFVFRYRSAVHWLETFRTYYGPINRAFGALGTTAQAKLEHDLLALAHEHNTSTTGALRIPSEYLEIVATKAMTDNQETSR
jgi:hypothetical protein